MFYNLIVIIIYYIKKQSLSQYIHTKYIMVQT